MGFEATNVAERKSTSSVALDEEWGDGASDAESYDQVDEESLSRQEQLRHLAKIQANSVLFFQKAAQALDDEAKAQVEAMLLEKVAQANLEAQAVRGGEHETMYQASSSVSTMVQDRRAQCKRFDARCKELKAESERHSQKILENMQQQDQRAADRLREMLERQREKAFVDSQRRAEQQKACRELRREYDRVYEDFYAKQILAAAMGSDADRLRPQSQGAARATRRSTFRPSSQGSTQRLASLDECPESTESPSSPGAMQRRDSQGSLQRPESRGSARPESRGSTQRPSSRGSTQRPVSQSSSTFALDAIYSREPIYADMKKSRELYCAELEKMATTLKQNEKRTEAYWRKLIGPDWRTLKNKRSDDGRASKGSRSEDEEEADGLSGREVRRQSSVASATRLAIMSKRMCRRRKSAYRAGPDMAETSPGGWSSSSTSSLLESSWELRNSRSEQVREQIQLQKEHRWAQIEDSLGKSRLRRTNTATALQEHIAASLEGWAAKSKTCFERKAANAVTSDRELLKKNSAFSERWEQAQRFQEEERAGKSAARGDTLQRGQRKTEALQQQQRDKVKAKMAEKASIADDVLAQRLRDYEEKANGDHLEKAKHISRQKKEEEEQYRRKARKDTELKNARSAKVAESKKNGPLENMRAKRKFRQDGAGGGDPRSPASGSAVSIPEMTLSVENCSTQLDSLQLRPILTSPSASSSLDFTSAAGTFASPVKSSLRGGASLTIDTNIGSLSCDPTPLASKTSLKPAGSLAATPLNPRLALASPTSPTGADILRCDGFREPPLNFDSNPEPDSDGSGEDHAFLEELESRSVQWLQDMRRKNTLV